MKPNVLYKYHKINTHLEEMLMSSDLWFSHQGELNDPYDCKYSLSDDLLTSLFKNASESLENDLKSIPSLHDRIETNVSPMLHTEKWMQIFYNMLFGKRLGWSTCCFTVDPLNELMWAFYADNYKGVCLEFDFSKTIDLYNNLHKVKYNDTFKEISSIDDLVPVLLTKKKLWRFEKEWRIISKVNGKVHFEKESLTGIIFGSKTQKSDIDNVIKILNENGFVNIKIKQVKFRIKGVTLDIINDLDI